MKLSELKMILHNLNTVEFILPNGKTVPEHFHVTEVGEINKRFIDCGGTVRNESLILFQLWTANDYDHRLGAKKLKSIIELSEKQLALNDLEIEVEFQSETIGKYGIEYHEGRFILVNKQTNCLAKDNCGIPKQKARVKLSSLNDQNSCCVPNSGCC